MRTCTGSPHHALKTCDFPDELAAALWRSARPHGAETNHSCRLSGARLLGACGQRSSAQGNGHRSVWHNLCCTIFAQAGLAHPPKSVGRRSVGARTGRPPHPNHCGVRSAWDELLGYPCRLLYRRPGQMVVLTQRTRGLGPPCPAAAQALGQATHRLPRLQRDELGGRVHGVHRSAVGARSIRLGAAQAGT